MGGSKVESAFHLSKVDKMSTRNIWELSGSFFKKKKLHKFVLCPLEILRIKTKIPGNSTRFFSWSPMEIPFCFYELSRIPVPIPTKQNFIIGCWYFLKKHKLPVQNKTLLFVTSIFRFRIPPIVIDDSSWKNVAESFTVALTLTLGGYESAIAPIFLIGIFLFPYDVAVS